MTTKKQTPRKSSPARSRKNPAAELDAQERLPNPYTSSEESIAELAHRLFLERGGEHGYDVDDWLEAERRVRNGH